ncbi:hypothetical protein OIU76_012155 [Salix suchowensis]|uniref:Uncharacterized protein n=1 Tax=Salix suchowensis TaxID=1278906 RepID=A0ABQ8ZVH9_9ROSI|nr:hypothetical protein OIU77_013694 [Salix suchowensis]KAJ6325011.1 hypothetical protein OIU76_012155 [Salix suchowensis]KAJ6357469.1 hypothetical protein OIU78_005340 [Salix suchowensis]
MRKTFYYSFLLTKAEEDAVAARSEPRQVTRGLVEIRDWYPAPRIDPNNPWQIRKSITRNEVVTTELTLSHEEMFEHVFRYWTLDMADHVVRGNKCFVILVDYTDDMPRKIQSESVFLKTGPNDTCILGLGDVVRARYLNPGDEVGLFWDMRSGTFGFKLLRQ